MAYVHRRSREHVRRTHEYGESHLLHETLDIVERSEGAPCRLVDTQAVEHCRELVAVFRTVDVYWRCTEDRHSIVVQTHGEVVGYLSSHTHHYSLRLLKVDDVEHTLQRQFVEV